MNEPETVAATQSPDVGTAADPDVTQMTPWQMKRLNTIRNKVDAEIAYLQKTKRKRRLADKVAKASRKRNRK